MKLRIVLCAVLGLYSMCAVTYALSQIYSAYAGCGSGCFGGEHPYKDSTNGTRTVDVQYRASGPNGFSADSAKISGALDTARGAWNATSQPYQFQSAQGASSPTLQLVLVDDIKGAPRNACMELQTAGNPQTGEITSGILYIKRSTFNNLTQDELSQLLEHELGHFIGLKDFRGNADQCRTIMAQAKDGCNGLRGSANISDDDVASVNKYVTHSTDCKDKRGHTTVTTGGGYVDPTPIPSYYPYTCYYYYSAYDIYDPCDCATAGQYMFTVYVLDDVICF